MDTNRLNQFKVVAETKNLREAASLLHISHAGLAKSIRVLEAELGVSLITKDGRGIKITSQGESLLEEMTACLAAEEKLKRRALGLDVKSRSQVRIGTFEVFSTYFSPEIVQALPKEAEVSFEELIPGDLENALVNENVDYGITYLTVPRGELDHVLVSRIRMGVFGVKAHKNVAFSDLPFVVPIAKVEGSPNKVRGLDGWPDDRIPRNIRYSVALMETAMALVRKGLGVAYLPHFVVERHNELMRAEYCLHEISPPAKVSITQPVYALKRKDREERASFRAICKALRALR